MYPFVVIHSATVTADTVARIRSECVLTGDNFRFPSGVCYRYTFEGTRASSMSLHLPPLDVDCVLSVAEWTTGTFPRPCLNLTPADYPVTSPAELVIERTRDTMGVTLLIDGRYVWGRVLDVLPRLRPGGLEKTVARVRVKFYPFLADDEVADVVAVFPAKYANLRTEAEANRAASRVLDMRAHGLGWRRVKVDGAEVWKKKEFSS